MTAKSKKRNVSGKTPEFEGAFLGKKTEELSTLIEQQVQPVFDELGIVIPVKSASLIRSLVGLESASAADLARAMDCSHQLVIQKLPALTKRKLVTCRNDSNDKRRKVYRLSAIGKKQVELLEECLAGFEALYAQLFKETGCDLFVVLEKTIAALQKEDLQSRFGSLARR